MRILILAVLSMMAITLTNYYHPSQRVGGDEIVVSAQQGQKQELENEYSNKYFSLKYPSTWQIVQDNNQATATTTISVQIMEKKKNDVDFRPNINIIVSATKWTEPASYLAQQTSQNNRKVVSTYKQLSISDTEISGCKGSLLSSSMYLQGYSMRSDQYIVKKSDNTTFIITATTDSNKYQSQMAVVNEILKSIVIK